MSDRLSLRTTVVPLEQPDPAPEFEDRLLTNTREGNAFAVRANGEVNLLLSKRKLLLLIQLSAGAMR
ncbi:hypothetical protein [Methylobacterium nigriterrae]|uniref:hypothetical protein n=1 Tax=Methylobacterium nigriterrae TaxID=3127512 RepID=UPI0030133586